MQKTIFITGAGAGIGKATAILFASKGWRVCATDINQASLDTLKTELGAAHEYFTLDVTKSDDIATVMAAFVAKCGAIDVLLNNAGLGFIDPFFDQTLKKHTSLVNVNVNGVLNCTYLAKPHLRRPTATIINMCSASANYGVPTEATYSATKFWVRGFTEALNIELENMGVHVCDILPNFVDTPMMQSDLASGDIVDNVGIKLTADDVAKTIWKAAHNRKKVHWHVDTAAQHILRFIAKLAPQSASKTVMKKLAGF